jgi:hypothetical protein
MDHYARAYSIFSRIRGYRRIQDMLHSLKVFGKSEAAIQRMKVIKFYEKYGEQATKEAFGADRKVVSRWRKRLSENGGSIAALAPKSTRPSKVRRSEVPIKIIEFIRKLREEHPKLGKEKIKPLLDEYCYKEGIPEISESTIGNIIKRYKLFFQRSGRIYHNPDSKWAQNKAKKKKRLRVKHPPRPSDFGHILSDAVERITDGVKDYFLSAIDAKLKFAVTLNYKRLTSRNNKDFYLRFKSIYPGTVRSWQLR